MTDKTQLQNEMLLVLIKTNEEVYNQVEEDILDYFTKEVMKNCKNEQLKEDFGGILKDKVHCPKCGLAKSVIWHGINPNGEDAHRKWFCTNCNTYFKEYEDGRIEEYEGWKGD